uniref:Ribosomal protein S14 n=3 Tax=Selaginella TaxID=3246 RepID=A0A650FRS5_9TRAC|nr:ribosomal protein S14 [Selaginella nummulariifolia]QGU93156.1 ribosomal protein S14 [Selaginella rossii]QGU93225.1 ribosomal protein S14 [Selaginella sanguinolenta]
MTAKKGLIQRGERRQGLGRKYHSIRRSPKGKMSEASSLDGRWEIHKESQSLPRNSAPTRLHRRRLLTGRPGANHRDSGPPRHVPREMAHACLSPGPVKSSWQ